MPDNNNTQFQSTLPVKGATFRKPGLPPATIFQSTLPVKGATIAGGALPDADIAISIHAPCEGSDQKRSFNTPLLLYFNPRSL